MTADRILPIGPGAQVAKAPYVFPVKLLSLSLFLTMVAVLWMGGNSFYIHYFLTHNIANDQQIAEKADEILYLDSVITQLSRAPTTGDAEFDKRYMNAIKEELDKKTEAFPDKGLREVIEATNRANEKIIALDRQYINLINQDKLGEAERLIHSMHYANANKLHLDGRRQLADKIRQASHQNLLSLESNIYTTLLLVTMVIMAIFIAWYYAVKSVRRWREELEATRASETKAKEEAEAANAALVLSEQAAKKSAIEAERANHAKSEFLTNMSHELRTPMHAILGFSRQAQKVPGVVDNEKLCIMLENIRISGKRLLNLLNHLLDLSKLEAGKIDLDFQQDDIHNAIDQTRLEMAPLLQAKNIHIHVYSADVSTIVWYDHKTMVQVFMNLLSNAVKFSPPGSEVAIMLSETKTASLKPALLCCVQDSGVGVPESELELIFDKFMQSSKTKSGAGGTGLGLAIVRQIIEAHKGKIWAENVPGGGAVFKILLPYSIDMQAKEAAGEQSQS